MKAVLVISHGSHSPQTKKEVEHLVELLKTKTGIKVLELAFLEIETPDIPTGLDICVQKGATEVLVLLNFLNSGRHVSRDIPVIVQQAQEKHPNVKFSISQPIGQHERIADLFVDLIEHA